MKWKKFGWHDIQVEVPEDWCLHSEGGDWESGFFRLDNGILITLEVKWERNEKAADIGNTLADLRKEMEKHDRKIEFSDASGLMKTVKLKGMKYEGMSWTGTISGAGVLSRCKSCNTTLVVRQYWEPGDEEQKALFSRVAGSIRDHLRSDRMSFWSVYGLQVKVPGTYRLFNREFLSGKCQLAFTRDKSRMEFLRLGFGRMVIEQEGLVDWFRRSHRLIRNLSGPDDVGIHGHDGMLFQAVRRSEKKFKGGMPVQSVLWYCEPSDKIYLVQTLCSDQKSIPDVMTAAENVTCHSD